LQRLKCTDGIRFSKTVFFCRGLKQEIRMSVDALHATNTLGRAADLKPMPLTLSLLFFGIPSAIGIASFYVLMPALHRARVPLLWNYTITFAGMFLLLLVAALVAHRLEGRPLSWQGLVRRFRIGPLTRSDGLWTAGLLIVYVGGQLLLAPTRRWLATALPLRLPEGLPHVLDPRVVQASVPSELVGVRLRGNWAMALWHAVVLSLNIVSEEFWWRGYILPRQELVHGRRTWLVHGLLWTLFHAPMWWNLVALLPSTLSLSFVASRTKNTTPGIVVHLVMNGLGFLITLLGILGLGA
jgi:membrane protease YdiL (CAAX protease family)